MRKKKGKIGIIILVFIIIIQTIVIYVIATSKSENTSETTTTISLVQASTRTIQKTLTSSGEIQTSSSEELGLITTKYFKTMCVEENDEVKAGENILQYSDGTYLTAPYNCLISKYSVPQIGSICTSTNSVTIENLDSLIISINVDETEISDIKKSQEVEIKMSAFEDKTYTGTISKINELGTYASNGTSFSVAIILINDGSIKLGMSASCTIVLQKVENVIAVPITGIQTKENEKYVVVVNSNGSTEERQVTTSVSDDEYVEIKSGVSEGETVQSITSSTKNIKTNSSSNQSQAMVVEGGMSMDGKEMQGAPSGGMQGRPSEMN